MSVEISYRDQATGKQNGASCSYRAPRPGEQVVIVIDGPSLPPAEPCHVCCPPGEQCPCADRKEPFCACNHPDAAPDDWAECPGCAVALVPDAAHARGCEWLAGVQAGLEAVRLGRTTLWDEVKQELGITDATQRDTAEDAQASQAVVTPARHLRGIGAHHSHQCPSCNVSYVCTLYHEEMTDLPPAELARLHHPAPCVDDPVEGTAVKIPPYWCAACLQGYHENCARESCRCGYANADEHPNW